MSLSKSNSSIAISLSVMSFAIFSDIKQLSLSGNSCPLTRIIHIFDFTASGSSSPFGSSYNDKVIFMLIRILPFEFAIFADQAHRKVADLVSTTKTFFGI